MQRSWLVRNLPNFLTIVRVAVPLTAWETERKLSTGALGWASFWLAVTGLLVATDFVDGRLARRLEVVSTFGKIADPVLDRLVIFSILAFYGLILQAHATSLSFAGWAIIIAARLYQEGQAIAWARRTVSANEIPGANWLGKVKFCWECLAITVGWLLMIWGGPAKYETSVFAFGALMLVAMWYGSRSIRAYNLALKPA